MIGRGEVLSYYRAALSAAKMGDLTAASRLVQCSIAFGENAPSAERLHRLLQINHRIRKKKLEKLRKLVARGKCARALRVRLPDTAKAHTIRGLLYARIGRRRAALDEFALALALDAGNELAKRAILALAH